MTSERKIVVLTNMLTIEDDFGQTRVTSRFTGNIFWNDCV